MTISDDHLEQPAADSAVNLRQFSWRDWFTAPVGFASFWFHSRRYRLLLGGIPAVLLGLFVMLGVLSRPFYSNESKAEHYTEAAQVAAAAEDYERADLYYRKLYDLDAMDEPTAFDAAVVCDAAGRTEEAFARMSRLAPADRPGYGDAHLWLAKGILAGKVELPDDQRNQLVEWHLTTASRMLETNLEPFFLLSQHHARLGNLDESATALQEVVSERPQLNYELSQIYTRRGKKAEADQASRTLVQLYERWEEQGRKLDANQHLRLADALANLGDLAATGRRLALGQRAYSKDLRFRRAMSQLAFRQASALRGEESEIRAEELALLEKALFLYPKNVSVLQRLASLTGIEGEEAEKARAMLNPILAEGTAPAVVHLILGSIMAEDGDNELAVVHLEEACRLSPMSAPALNNLAWVLANTEQPKLDRALQLANSAIKQQPTVPNYRETRGQIYVKLERWAEAVADLEFALGRMPEKRVIHQGLATAYEQLGDSRLAKLHQEKAAAAEQDRDG